MDSGFSGFSDLIGSGELPAPAGVRCYTDVGEYETSLAGCSGTGAHGTWVSETVTDVAPAVSLYIADVRHASWSDSRSVVEWMISEGVTVINRSVGGGYNGPGDGTSPFSWSILNTVDRAVDGGITFANAAGNNHRHVWYGPYSDPDGDRLINFEGADESNHLRISDGSSLSDRRIFFQLRWEDSWGGATSDLDLFVVNGDTDEVVASSRDNQAGGDGDFPYEWLSRTHFEVPPEGNNYYVAVQHVSGPAPSWIQLWGTHNGFQLEHCCNGGSMTDAAESANPGVLAVGATHYWDTNTIAAYSSQGPTPDGRVKPDIVGTACAQVASRVGSTRDGNTCWFGGTSQASPHVAGLAALVKGRFPGYTPDQVADYLKHYAQQRTTPDPNNTWGHGFAVLPPPSDAPAPGFDTSCG